MGGKGGGNGGGKGVKKVGWDLLRRRRKGMLGGFVGLVLVDLILVCWICFFCSGLDTCRLLSSFELGCHFGLTCFFIDASGDFNSSVFVGDNPLQELAG